MREWVLVDTCIWAAFFQKPGSPEKAAVDELLDADRVALVGPILTEVLLGFRRDDQADWIAARLRLAHLIEADWNDWREAARLGRQLAARGHQLPVSDLLLATVANREGLAVYTTDPHFDLMANLTRYSPS